MSNLETFFSIAIPTLVISFVFFATDPRGMRLLSKASSSLNIQWSFFSIPLWLLPFGLAVIFEAQTKFVPAAVANLFFYCGRYVFPLGYTWKKLPDSFMPLLNHPDFFQPAHTWDLIFWAIISFAYGFFTRKVRTGFAFAMAPLLVLVILAIFHFFAWQLGYIHWGLPARVVG